ncbi:MAG: hypothetical protein AB7F23_03185 [Phycisphaerae bacterium]
MLDPEALLNLPDLLVMLYTGITVHIPLAVGIGESCHCDMANILAGNRFPCRKRELNRRASSSKFFRKPGCTKEKDNADRNLDTANTTWQQNSSEAIKNTTFKKFTTISAEVRALPRIICESHR